MNGKSIRKRLMRRRDRYRACITVRLSMREFGLIEPPEVVFPGMIKLDGFRGEWDALEKSARFRGVNERQEVERLRDIACELDLAAREAGFCGYAFGEEV